MSDKHVKAIADYYRAQQEVKRLTTEIGDALVACIEAQSLANDQAGTPYAPIQEHLKEAYAYDHDDGETGYMRNGDPKKYLDGVCPFCLKAHLLIQERKAARQKFGAAKRWITRLGKAEASK